MSENKSNENYLLLKDILNEVLLRDIFLFTLLFLFVFSQSWDNILLLLYPIVTFAFSLFFRIISTNKWRSMFEDSPIIYNPLGLEKRHANRLNFSALIQLILIFWIGAESLYHPQLIDQYYNYFIALYSFIFTFGFYWIMIDLWKYSKITLTLSEEENILLSQKIEIIVSLLKIKKFRLISLINLIVFLCLNLLTLFFIFLDLYHIIPGFPYNLPGTGIEGSEPIIIPYFFLLILIISPLLTIIFLILVYRDINNFNIGELNKKLNSFPKNVQSLIIENLKRMNKKFNDELKME